MALGTLDALAMVNLTVSAWRPFVCEQLAIALPGTRPSSQDGRAHRRHRDGG